jgi:hypothetical protein
VLSELRFGVLGKHAVVWRIVLGCPHGRVFVMTRHLSAICWWGWMVVAALYSATTDGPIDWFIILIMATLSVLKQLLKYPFEW